MLALVHEAGAVPEQVRWAVEVLDSGPEERPLEIGCGPGVALSLICERLVGGQIVAIDRYKEIVRRLLRPGGALSLLCWNSGWGMKFLCHVRPLAGRGGVHPHPPSGDARWQGWPGLLDGFTRTAVVVEVARRQHLHHLRSSQPAPTRGSSGCSVEERTGCDH